jgi:hypothetical protein
MHSLLRVGRLATLTAAGLLLAGAHGARANDQDLRATTVPATACQPASSAQAAEVVLANGAWAFTGTNTGTITFYCPLPINGNTVSDATDDNDISAFRVYYRDTDGTGSAAEVTARLIFRTTGVGTIGSTWSSNSSNVMTDTMAFQLVTHDMSASAMYSFLVTLSRTSTTESPAFTGIDFANPQVP